MTRPRTYVIAILAFLVFAGCARERPEQTREDPLDAKPSGELEARGLALIEAAYEKKRVGENGAALSLIEEACALFAEQPGRDSARHASCLDDQASVILRMGDFAKARGLYEQARRLLGAHVGEDHWLMVGLGKRLALLDAMTARGFVCAEPESMSLPDAGPDAGAGAALPYFPDVEEMQLALGRLNPKVAVCREGIPEAVTVRATISGTGVLLHAEVRGEHEGTPLAACVVERLAAAIPSAKLPPFAACFRGFTYPFMIGTHEKPDAGPGLTPTGSP